MFYLSILFDLTRPWIALFAALSAVTGMILAAGRLSPAMGVLSLGVFFLACGASALNQFQEIDFDRLMARTRARPLPSGRLSPRWGITCSLILILSGLLLLSFASWRASLLGAAALVWYNGFYTPLKKKTPFAVIPGALIGAIPPFLGWVVGGGDWRSPRILALAFFFFLWQVPHFWKTMREPVSLP
jgi:protoheme IX farnesyltransferase